MSLKRYAILAAVNYHNQQQQQQQQRQNSASTTEHPATIKKAKMTAAQATSSEIQENKNNNKLTNWISLNAAAPPAIATAKATTAIATNIGNGTGTATATGTATGTGVASSSNGNTITTYYGGGLGLFHQQNLRANGGMGGSYINANGISGNSGGGGGGIGGVGGNGGGASYPNTINGNVNLLLGGAMLSLVTTILCVVCYCCHRNIKKRTEAAYRQQRQWLENDPNMEIYSVEQCYETSGLFLGDSTDGLSNIPALNHEPPPSYDAVVAMQEQLLQQQQQQQQHQHYEQQQQQQQRISPPPGYRSSLDVSSMNTIYGGGAGTENSSRCTLDGAACMNDSNGNLNLNLNGIACANTFQQHKHNQMLSGFNPLLNMKKVLQAQSCCSLQRAEVENMWNAAAAAVAARNSTMTPTPTPAPPAPLPPLECGGTTSFASSATSSGQATPTAATTLMMARKSLPTYAFGRNYRPQKSYYRRGCPLCGKFRYNAEDALTLFTENESDNPDMIEGNTKSASSAAAAAAAVLSPSSSASSSASSCTAMQCNRKEISHVLASYQDDSNNNNTEERMNPMAANGEACNSIPTKKPKLATAPADQHCDECLCDSRVATPSNWHHSCSTLQPLPQQHDEVNGNEIPVKTSDFTPKIQLKNETNQAQNNRFDDNANSTATVEEDDDEQVPTTSRANCTNECNILANATPEAATTSTAAETTTTTAATMSADAIDLSLINDNGIIRLDMSRIIDKTGLPTYEAALKLESSGYV